MCVVLVFPIARGVWTQMIGLMSSMWYLDACGGSQWVASMDLEIFRDIGAVIIERQKTLVLKIVRVKAVVILEGQKGTAIPEKHMDYYVYRDALIPIF